MAKDQSKTCFAFGGANFFDGAKSVSLIELQQTGVDRFTVVYGLQCRADLTYAAAARELGECLMHFQSCEGHVDNRTRAEARKDGGMCAVFEPVKG